MSPTDFDDLRRQVRDLTDRVARLEASLAVRPGPSLGHVAGTGNDMALPVKGDSETLGTAREAIPILPVLGIATLGLAGAYLLRAIAESEILPFELVFTVGALYAVAWLLWAPRAHAGRRLATTLYSLTAALILSPLLWEATVRFHTINPWQTSAILLAFTIIGMAVSWQKDLATVAAITTLAAIVTASALLIATYDLLPFTFVLLGIAAAVETCACFSHCLGERWLAAAAADLSIVLATWVVTNPRGLPEGYAPVPAVFLFAAQMVLLGIYLGSVTVRTLLFGLRITNFETGQCVFAFLIGLGGAIRLVGEGSHHVAVIAGFALLCGAASYIISFKALARRDSQGRNFYTYATFGILLVLAGCRILLNDVMASVAFSLQALACLGAGVFSTSFTLKVHGSVYLLFALVLSGAFRDSAALLLGADPWPHAIPPALWVAVAVAGTSYWLAESSTRALKRGWNTLAFRIVIAGALIWLVLGVVAGSLTGAYHNLLGAPVGDSYCATLRTGAVVAVTLLLAFAGSRLKFQCLGQLVYPLMLLGAYRLVTDDLHQDRKAAMFFSLALYGVALIAVPRLRRVQAHSI
jgi:hypothetical protein